MLAPQLPAVCLLHGLLWCSAAGVRAGDGFERCLGVAILTAERKKRSTRMAVHHGGRHNAVYKTSKMALSNGTLIIKGTTVLAAQCSPDKPSWLSPCQHAPSTRAS